MTRRKPVAPATEPERHALSAAAAAALKERYQAAQAANTRLDDLLTGIVLGAGIDPARVQGFDDASGELLLAPD